MQKAISAGQSEPPAPFRDPFVYVSDERVRTVIDGRQPEPLEVNVEELQSVHHAVQGPGPKQEPIVKGRKERKAVRAVVLPALHQSQVESQRKGLARAIVLLSHRQKQRVMLDRLRWRLIPLRLNRRRLGSR